MIYVGAGLYEDKRRVESTFFNPRPIANNSLIVSGSDGLKLLCVSNSSQSRIGTITTYNDVTLNIGYRGNLWQVVNPNKSPGVLRLQTKLSVTLTASDQGIYTCTISDDTENELYL